MENAALAGAMGAMGMVTLCLLAIAVSPYIAQGVIIASIPDCDSFETLESYLVQVPVDAQRGEDFDGILCRDEILVSHSRTAALVQNITWDESALEAAGAFVDENTLYAVHDACENAKTLGILDWVLVGTMVGGLVCMFLFLLTPCPEAGLGVYALSMCTTGVSGVVYFVFTIIFLASYDEKLGSTCTGNGIKALETAKLFTWITLFLSLGAGGYQGYSGKKQVKQNRGLSSADDAKKLADLFGQMEAANSNMEAIVAQQKGKGKGNGAIVTGAAPEVKP